MVARLTLSCLPLLAAGCAIWIEEPSRGDTRGVIDNRDLRPFLIGVTTREDVLLALGEPDLQSEDGSTLIYWWYQDRAFCLLPPPPFHFGMSGMRISLCIKFDGVGKVVRHKFVGSIDGSRPFQEKENLDKW
jgi:hypothetical protein